MNKKITKSSLSEKKKLAKRRKYAEIKEDPELYERQREKEKEWYRRKKAKGPVVGINEKSPRDIRQQRKKWKKASRRYRQKKKEEKLKETTTVFIECPETNNVQKMENNEEDDPLQSSVVNVKIRKIRYRQLIKRNILLNEIKKLKNRNAVLRKKISSLEVKLKEKVSNEDCTKFNEELNTFKTRKVDRQIKGERVKKFLHRMIVMHY
nr:uncharacterized protein LOC113399570 [Vanessa tameamea]